MTQRSNRLAKFYLQIQNYRAKGIMSPSWIMWRPLQNSYFGSSIAVDTCFNEHWYTLDRSTRTVTIYTINMCTMTIGMNFNPIFEELGAKMA